MKVRLTKFHVHLFLVIVIQLKFSLMTVHASANASDCTFMYRCKVLLYF